MMICAPRNHLVTLLKMAQKGNVPFPDSEELIQHSSGNTAWQNAIDKGVKVGQREPKR